ncbi:MAG: hypothetical protein GX793_06950 [Bacteroidales bacterium]|jgi:hypothetical protein|nr:hypothetical protein [Bacteroidales bacterium]MCK9499051.1 hypothetical protein [Bacteroidales bacterium]MDY0315355.1 hypothetical protein [Bacteroidales bacterium]NLB86782.1 hypothetical protein [Bacteroidales bacterium]
MKDLSKLLVLFVEGDTEAEFYRLLINYYKEKSSKPFPEVKRINLKGIGRFEAKVVSKLKNDILKDKKYKDLEIIVFCCYDTDVFELAKKPPTNWSKVRKGVAELGIKSFYEIKSQKMIEDWFIKDLDGICDFLKIKKPKKVSQEGLKVLKGLFKTSNKIYQKGYYTHKFLEKLDLSKIIKALKGVFDDLERYLNVK